MSGGDLGNEKRSERALQRGGQGGHERQKDAEKNGNQREGMQIFR